VGPRRSAGCRLRHHPDGANVLADAAGPTVELTIRYTRRPATLIGVESLFESQVTDVAASAATGRCRDEHRDGHVTRRPVRSPVWRSTRPAGGPASATSVTCDSNSDSHTDQRGPAYRMVSSTVGPAASASTLAAVRMMSKAAASAAPWTTPAQPS